MAPQPPASTFPQDLPPREQSWKDRNCPGMTGYFSFRLSSYSLQTSDKAVLARRVCMLTILLLRTAISVKEVVWAAIRLNIAWLIINIVFGIISFFFVAMALEKIGEAQGRRKVLGILVGRWHFDVFLLVMAIIHAGIFIGLFFGLGGGGGSAGWLALWLLIFIVYWITTWQPEAESNV